MNDEYMNRRHENDEYMNRRHENDECMKQCYEFALWASLATLCGTACLFVLFG